MTNRSSLPQRRRGDRIPPLSILLGYGPVAVLPVLAMVSAALPPQPGFNLLLGGQLWAAGVLIFMGGVRRGLSFDRNPEHTLRQLIGSFLYFFFGLGAMIVPIGYAFLLLIIGYAIGGVLDRKAARAGEAPRHFAQLRPIQAAIAIIGLGALLGRLLLL